MNYKMLYEITYFNIPFILFIPLIVIIILSLILIRRKSFNISLNGMLGIIIVLVICIIFETICIGNHEENMQYMNNGDCYVVEGKVENFIPRSTYVNGPESFDVKGIKFSYTEAIINGGLNHSISNEIGNGSIVKIYYKEYYRNRVILKILKQIKN